MALPVIRRSAALPASPSRRAGLLERRLLLPADSPHQNVVLVEADAGAEVELHPVPNSESFFVLEGRIRVFGPGFREELAAGDFCHFPPGTSHGVFVLEGPARFLVIFAPAAPGP